jgi:hypothetical protein
MSALASASARAEAAAVQAGEPASGTLKRSTLSRWGQGAALVDRLNQVDLQLRRLGLPDVSGHFMFRGLLGLRQSQRAQELAELLQHAPPMRLQHVLRIVRLLLAEKPDEGAIQEEVSSYLASVQQHAALSSTIQAYYKSLKEAGVPEDELEQRVVDLVSEQIATYSQG